jgi:VanZ family protein
MKFSKENKLLIVWSVFVFIVLIMPVSPGGPVSQVMSIFDYSDKIIHFILFGVFAYLFSDAIKNKIKIKFLIYIYSFFSSCLFAGLAELFQMIVPTRAASLNDFYAGAIGAFFMLLIPYVRDKK